MVGPFNSEIRITIAIPTSWLVRSTHRDPYHHRYTDPFWSVRYLDRCWEGLTASRRRVQWLWSWDHGVMSTTAAGKRGLSLYAISRRIWPWGEDRGVIGLGLAG